MRTRTDWFSLHPLQYPATTGTQMSWPSDFYSDSHGTVNLNFVFRVTAARAQKDPWSKMGWSRVLIWNFPFSKSCFYLTTVHLIIWRSVRHTHGTSPFHSQLFLYIFYTCFRDSLRTYQERSLHAQLVREHSATVVLAHWTTVDWSWPKERY